MLGICGLLSQTLPKSGLAIVSPSVSAFFPIRRFHQNRLTRQENPLFLSPLTRLRTPLFSFNRRSLLLKHSFGTISDRANEILEAYRKYRLEDSKIIRNIPPFGFSIRMRELHEEIPNTRAGRAWAYVRLFTLLLFFTGIMLLCGFGLYNAGHVLFSDEGPDRILRNTQNYLKTLDIVRNNKNIFLSSLFFFFPF
jgi:hypothetical protein